MFHQRSVERKYGEGRRGVKTLWRENGAEVALRAEESVCIRALLRENWYRKGRFFAPRTGFHRQICLKQGTFIVPISPGEQICRIRKTGLRARRLAMQFLQRPAGVKRNSGQWIFDSESMILLNRFSRRGILI
ncbi:MAG TPA: hypothetical protein DCM07_13695 [Planctomycetaceae bacterium]|nr:hypothetical protein [Gimesia sp.]HAH45878.1 hypothetical protein [Planctomycetaceae bacterium]HBL41793.1 hypothetical protein [Planctomycetaceae bacterium]|tara:strand:- start:3091 stop:3489 length:399 start_codon:yes stop_codon:yes gene_type:complete